MLELFDGFLAAVSTETHIPFHKEANGKYHAHVEFEGGRHQNVLITMGEDDMGDATINFYSVICKVPSDNCDLLKDALRLNISLTYGSIALMDDSLIIHRTYFLQDIEPERFLKSLIYVAAKADELEEVMIKEDVS